MARIYTHSLLESAVCDAKFIDATKARHGKVGPARQGQVGHRFAESYLTHLFRTKRSSDMEVGEQMWRALRHQLSATDERAIEDAIESMYRGQIYPWVESAESFSAEGQIFVTIPDRRVVPVDRVHLLSGPVFRATIDLIWRGDGPIGTYRGLSINDWKFHRQIEHVLEPGMNRQLKRYAACVMGDEDKTVGGYIGFPRHSYYEHDVFERADLLRAWEDLVCAPVEAAERKLSHAPDVPDRCVGSHCRDCDLLRGCEAALRYPYEVHRIGEQSVEARAAALEIAKQIVFDLNASLKGSVNAGDVSGDDGVEVGISAVESLSISRQDIERVAGAYLTSEAIDRCMRAGKTAVDKALKSCGVKPDLREEIIAELRAVSDRKLSSKLSVKKKKHERSATDLMDDMEGGA